MTTAEDTPDASRGTSLLPMVIGALLVVAGWVVFGLTRCETVFPGEPANLLLQARGIIPRTGPEFPLWTWSVRALLALPLPASPWSVATGLNVALGGIALLLIYSLLRGLLLSALEAERGAHAAKRWLATGAAVIGALALAFATPFWILATRSHHAMLSVTLLLLCGNLLLQFWLRGSAWLGLLLALFYGAGAVEFATFTVLAPLVTIAMLVAMWYQGRLTAGYITGVVVAGIAGLALYLLAAWTYCQSPGFELYDYGGFFEVLRLMWVRQYRLIMSSLPQVGWLIVLLTSGVPWLVALLTHRRALVSVLDWSMAVLHMTLALLSGLAVLELGVGPWGMLGYSRVLVTPYVLVAMTLAIEIAFWGRLAFVESGWRSGVRGVLCSLLAVLMVVGLIGSVGWSVARNHATVKGRGLDAIDRCARLLAANERTGDVASFLVLDSNIEDLVRHYVAEGEAPRHVVNLRQGHNASYRRFMASMVNDPRLKNLVRIGLRPFLDELLRDLPQVEQRVAILGSPDIWRSVGRQPYPDRLVYRCAVPDGGPDPDETTTAYLDFWSALGPQLATAAEPLAINDPVARIADDLLRYGSLVANNLGVTCEDEGRLELAVTMYNRARELYPANLSAMLNLKRLIDAGLQHPDAIFIQAEYDDLVDNPLLRRSAFQLAVVYGYVRMAEAYSGIARTLALSGRPRDAARAVNSALGLSASEAEQTALRLSLADLYARQQDTARSREVLVQLLREAPDNREALIGLARILTAEGRLDEAEALLERAKRPDARDDDLEIEQAAVALARGHLDEVHALLKPVLPRHSSNPRPWALRLSALTRSQDWDGIDQLAQRMRGVRELSLLAAEAEGLVALHNMEFPKALLRYGEVLARWPNSIPLLERVTRISLIAGQPEQAREYAHQIIMLESENALANYVIGNALIADEEWALAEQALRQSLAGRETPEALNDLGWVLFKQEQLPEAETMARRATELAPSLAPAWATLGEIVMASDRLEDAEQVLEQGMAAAPEHPTVMLLMARVQHRKGNRTYAVKLMEAVAAKPGRMTSDDEQLMTRLRQEMRVR